MIKLFLKVSNKYERILHENHGDHLYTVHHQDNSNEEEQQHCIQYVHVQQDTEQQQQIQTSFLEDSPKRYIYVLYTKSY